MSGPLLEWGYHSIHISADVIRMAGTVTTHCSRAACMDWLKG